MEFSNKVGSPIVIHIANRIKENRDFLSEIDGAVGDGDHGINMSKGFTIALEEINNSKNLSMSESLIVVSTVLVNKIGGSMGPLYGSFFRGLSVGSRKHETIDQSVIYEMIQKGYRNISVLTDASVGDKTLMDVLIPAKEAYKNALDKGKDFNECAKEMISAAEEGLESTKNMVAKLGRGTRLGDRSLGHQDAGATSCYIILLALVEGINQLES